MESAAEQSGGAKRTRTATTHTHTHTYIHTYAHTQTDMHTRAHTPTQANKQIHDIKRLARCIKTCQAETTHAGYSDQPDQHMHQRPGEGGTTATQPVDTLRVTAYQYFKQHQVDLNAPEN